jgi:protein-S-isoprenylcysteine O-methyltransferase Ste14
VILLRHLVAVAVLPFTVTVLVPIWIARGSGVSPGIGPGPGVLVLQVLGVIVGLLGLVLFGWSLRRFATEGQGTLAPWDPPRQLVLHGPYRYVRNPMISGVVLVLCGEAAVLVSWPRAVWALTFTVLNLVYIPLLEEPMLAARFGDAYREYCRHVPRLVPRLTPWSPADQKE